MKKELRSGPMIEAALKTQVVLCRIKTSFGQLDESKTYTVRDIRKKNGELQVKILEGWFYPAEIWTEEKDA